MADIIQLRRDTSTNWTTENPVLANGELGYETDTLRCKVGDGVTDWNTLLYFIQPMGSIDHGTLVGLDDDDHTHYHTDSRGDARYYTQALLNGGQLDSRYYTETEIDANIYTKAELDAGQLDNRYYTETEADAAFATSAQGTLADSAVQPGDNVSDLTNDANYKSYESGAVLPDPAGYSEGFLFMVTS